MKKILIVEDDPDISRALVIRTKSHGYQVATAEDAVLAMTRAVELQPDLAILDISVPGGNGFQVAERLQGDPVTAGCPVVFITASKLPEMRERAVASGAVGFFEKPYNAEDLLALVDSVLAAPPTTTI
jgi:CheY-like chemotaxis protein